MADGAWHGNRRDDRYRNRGSGGDIVGGRISTATAPRVASPTYLLDDGEPLPSAALTALRCTARSSSERSSSAYPRPDPRSNHSCPPHPRPAHPCGSSSSRAPSGRTALAPLADIWPLPPDRIDLPGHMLSPIHVLR